MLKDLFRFIKILHIFLKARIDVDIEAFKGGQDHYEYIISVE